MTVLRGAGVGGGGARPAQSWAGAWTTSVADVGAKGKPKAKGKAKSKGKAKEAMEKVDVPLDTILAELDKTPVEAKKGKKAAGKAKAGGEGPKHKPKKGTKKGKEKEVSPIFTRLPNAAPTDEFPIIQSFEKQRALPEKPKIHTQAIGKGKGKLNITSRSIISSDSDPEDRTDSILHRLAHITAAARPPAAKKRARSPSLAPSDGDSDLDVGCNDAEKEGKELMLLKYLCGGGAGNDTMRGAAPAPSLERSGPTARTEYILTPNLNGVRAHDPSTITQIDEAVIRGIAGLKNGYHDTSSSQLPYSSPLVRKSNGHGMANGRAPLDRHGSERDNIVRPKPTKHADVELLEALVERGVDEHEHDRGRDKRLGFDSHSRPLHVMQDGKGENDYDEMYDENLRRESHKRPRSPPSLDRSRHQHASQSLLKPNQARSQAYSQHQSQDWDPDEPSPYNHPSFYSSSEDWSTLRNSKRSRNNNHTNPFSSNGTDPCAATRNTYHTAPSFAARFGHPAKLELGPRHLQTQPKVYKQILQAHAVKSGPAALYSRDAQDHGPQSPGPAQPTHDRVTAFEPSAPRPVEEMKPYVVETAKGKQYGPRDRTIGYQSPRHGGWHEQEGPADVRPAPMQPRVYTSAPAGPSRLHGQATRVEQPQDDWQDEWRQTARGGHTAADIDSGFRFAPAPTHGCVERRHGQAGWVGGVY